jgi:hypothetical protein
MMKSIDRCTNLEEGTPPRGDDAVGHWAAPILNCLGLAMFDDGPGRGTPPPRGTMMVSVVVKVSLRSTSSGQVRATLARGMCVSHSPIWRSILGATLGGASSEPL